ncbi:polysaccharide biosynthesis tyrosine autokinase [Amylibacter sp. SFDW26]|uniref:GumC family protein n=1 Tax=Amylibacter sp. SFDW26 TaxID=2652722 RepID=UPI001D0156D4|nr:polysaccharide biosynthesis tyrosine autokinase [Amylibacter sp. SFDW26]
MSDQIRIVEKSDELDPFTLLEIIWRGKLYIISCALFGVLLGGLYVFSLATPMYPAKAIIALETKTQNVVDIESVLSGEVGGSEQVNTELEVIRSRNIIKKLVSQLNLIDDLEFNDRLNESRLPNILGWSKRLFGIQGVIKTETEIVNDVIDNVINAVSVANVRQSLVFSINVKTTDPEKSALIANTLAEIYIQDALDVKFLATERAGKWLSERAAELKQELEKSELKIKQFSDGTQLINEDSLAVLSKQLKDMRQRVIDLKSDEAVLKAKLQAFRTAISLGDVEGILQAANDTRLQTIQQRVSEGLARSFEFDARVEEISKQLNTDLLRAEQQYEAMALSEKTFSKEIKAQSADLVQLQQLQREAQANSLLYESFLSRLKETTIQKGLQTPESRLLSSAVPRQASSPKIAFVLAFSFFLGGALGAGIILFREFNNNSFGTVDELESYMGISVLGAIPKIAGVERKDILFFAIKNPTSVFAEAIRNLRTSILLSDLDQPPQVIMVTSSVPGEGKTTKSLTLAQNLSGLSKRVIILECDIRKRIFSEYFNIDDQVGFLSVMSGNAKLKDAILKHEEMGVDILIGEKSSINAADVFSSERFAAFIKRLRTEYDYIIIDSAPVLAVPDARIIGQYVDAIIYSVLWNSTSKTQLKQGVSMFHSVGLKIDGLVLNNIDAKEMRRRGYSDQYAYSSDSEYYEN